MKQDGVRTGWTSTLARLCLAVLLIEGVTGLAVTFGPFHAGATGPAAG